MPQLVPPPQPAAAADTAPHLAAGRPLPVVTAAAAGRGGGGGQDDGGECIICMDAAKDSVCVPCGHNAGCFACLSAVKAAGGTCPVCRAALDQVIRLYKV